MLEFFETYKTAIFYALVVVGGVVLMNFLTGYLYNSLLKSEQNKPRGLRPSTLRLLKRIVNAIWLMLGVMAICALFFVEFYQKLYNNFRLLIYVGVMMVASILLASTVNLWFKRKVEQKTLLQEDPTVFKFMRYVAVFAVYILGIMFILLAFPSFKAVAQTALGGAGVLALIIGVASQEALANIVGGVFIISFKPFKIGDIIKLSDTMVGTVVDITLRHTVLKNPENKMIVIPNAIINKEKVVNYNLVDLRICERIEIGISYDSDIDLAKKIMREECERHPLLLDNRTATQVLDGKPKVRVALIALNESSVTIRAWAWAKNYDDSFNMRCDLLESIKKRFDRENIEIPFPYRTVVIKEQAEKQTL